MINFFIFLLGLLRAPEVIRTAYWGHLKYIYFFFYRLRKKIVFYSNKISKIKIKGLRKRILRRIWPKKPIKYSPLPVNFDNLNSFIATPGRKFLSHRDTLLNRLARKNIIFEIFNNFSSSVHLEHIKKYRFFLGLKINSIIFLNNKIIINRPLTRLNRIRKIIYNYYCLKLTEAVGLKYSVTTKKIVIYAYHWEEKVKINWYRNKNFAKRFKDKRKHITGTFKILPKLVSINLQGIISLTFIIAFEQWKPVFQTYNLFPTYNFDTNYFVQFPYRNKFITNIINLFNNINTLKSRKIRLPKIYYYLEHKLFTLLLLPKVIFNTRFKALKRYFYYALISLIFKPFKFIVRFFFTILKTPLSIIIDISLILIEWIIIQIAEYILHPILYIFSYFTFKLFTLIQYIYWYICHLFKILISDFYITIFFNPLKKFYFNIDRNRFSFIQLFILTLIFLFYFVDIIYLHIIFNENMSRIGFILYISSFNLFLLSLLYEKFSDYISNNVYLICFFYFFVMYIIPRFNFLDVVSITHVMHRKYDVRMRKLITRFRRSKQAQRLDYFNLDTFSDFYHWNKMLRNKMIEGKYVLTNKENLFLKYYELSPFSKLSQKKALTWLYIYIDTFFFSFIGILFVLFFVFIIIYSFRKFTTINELNEEMFLVKDTEKHMVEKEFLRNNYLVTRLNRTGETILYKNYMEYLYCPKQELWRYRYHRTWVEESANSGYIFAVGQDTPLNHVYRSNDREQLAQLDFFIWRVNFNIKEYYRERRKAAIYGEIDNSLYNFKWKQHPLLTLQLEDIPEFKNWEVDEEQFDEEIEDHYLLTVINQEYGEYEEKLALQFLEKNNIIEVDKSKIYFPAFTSDGLPEFDMSYFELNIMFNTFIPLYHIHDEQSNFFLSFLANNNVLDIFEFDKVLNQDLIETPAHTTQSNSLIKIPPFNRWLDKMVKTELGLVGNGLYDVENIFFYNIYIDSICQASKEYSINSDLYIRLQEEIPFQYDYTEDIVVDVEDDLLGYLVYPYLQEKAFNKMILTQSTDQADLYFAKLAYIRNEEDSLYLISLGGMDSMYDVENPEFRITKIYADTKIFSPGKI